MYGQQQNGWEAGGFGGAPVNELGLAPLALLQSSFVSNALKSVPIVGGLFKKASPRYNGNGPLISTVNGFLTRMAAGDLAVITDLDRERRTNKDTNHRRAWAMVWDNEMLKQPLTAQQMALIARLDPSKAGQLQPAAAVPYASGAKPVVRLPTATEIATAAKPQLPAGVDTLLQIAAGATGGSYTPAPAVNATPAGSGYGPSDSGGSLFGPSAATGDPQVFGMSAKTVGLAVLAAWAGSKLLGGGGGGSRRRH